MIYRAFIWVADCDSSGCQCRKQVRVGSVQQAVDLFEYKGWKRVVGEYWHCPKCVARAERQAKKK